jgi:hypothetical protein
MQDGDKSHSACFRGKQLKTHPDRREIFAVAGTQDNIGPAAQYRPKKNKLIPHELPDKGQYADYLSAIVGSGTLRNKFFAQDHAVGRVLPRSFITKHRDAVAQPRQFLCLVPSILHYPALATGIKN